MKPRFRNVYVTREQIGSSPDSIIQLRTDDWPGGLGGDNTEMGEHLRLSLDETGATQLRDSLLKLLPLGNVMKLDADESADLIRLIDDALFHRGKDGLYKRGRKLRAKIKRGMKT